MTKTILIVEAGIRDYKEGILSSLQSSGATLILATGLDATIDSSWADKYVSHRFRFSYVTNDLIEKTEEYLNQNNLTLDGALSYVETSVHYVNELQHKFKLPVVSTLKGKSIRNKAIMRKLLQQFSAYQPKYYSIATLNELKELLKGELQFPLVMKPTEMMSSLGVVLAQSKQEILELYPKVAKVDFRGEDLREQYGDMDTGVLVEEYIKGPEYSVEVIVQSGKSQILAITKKSALTDQFFDEMGHEFPAYDLSKQENERIKEFIESIHNALKFQNTITHTEIKMRDGMPILMEVNSRICGDLISDLIEKSYKISIGRLLIDVATLTPNTQEPVTNPKTHSLQFLTTTESGRILSVPSGVIPYVKAGEIIVREPLLGTTRLGHRLIEGRLSESTEKSGPIEFQKAILVTPAKDTIDSIMILAALPSDLPQIITIENEAWPEEMRAQAAIIQKRHSLNTQAYLIAFSTHTGKALGFVYTVPIDSIDTQNLKPWTYYSDLSVDSSHFKSPTPKMIDYIVSISVLPNAPRGVATALVKASVLNGKATGKLGLYYGIRIPQYGCLSDSILPQNYLNDLKAGKRHADLYKMATNAGGRALQIVKDYYTDLDSANFGVIIEHRWEHE